MTLKPGNSLPDPKSITVFEIVRNAIENFYFDAPFVIGITGAGGAGKTTFGNNIMKYYGSEVCISIDLDDYLISRKERQRLGLSGYNPKANKLVQAQKDITSLVSGCKILKPRYDHSNGEILPAEEIPPKDIIVIEGITTLYRELRDLNHISFFLDALEETQIKSRIQWDTHKRGYSLKEALALYESLKPEYKRFIEPTKNFVSVICEVGTDYVMKPIKNKDWFKKDDKRNNI